MSFVGQHPIPGPATAATFLTPDFLGAGAFSFNKAMFSCFDFVEQQLAGKKTVQALLARGLAFDLQASRLVAKHDAGGSLVHVLPAMTAGPDKGFLDFCLPHAQSGHAIGQLGLLLRADGKRRHAGR